MIKFFRHIRKQLLTENLPTGQAGKFSPPERRSRAGKYLIYVIGEIILVVIRILMVHANTDLIRLRIAKLKSDEMFEEAIN